MTANISTRLLYRSDLTALIKLGTDMQKESLIQFPALDAERIEEFLYICETMPQLAYGVIAENGENAIGFITATMGTHSFSGESIASHDAWYISPAYRNGFIAKKLISGFEDWAFHNGAYRAILAIHTGLNIDKMDRFIKLMGYSHMGGTYCKDGEFFRNSDRNRQSA